MPEPREYGRRHLPLVTPPRKAAPQARLPHIAVDRGEPPWPDMLAAVRQFVEQHDRTPASNSADQNERRLGVWWSKQHQVIPGRELAADRRALVADLDAFVDGRRKKARATAAEKSAAERRDRARAQVEQAARRQIEKARALLEKPYLLPGDREVLELRIANPTLSVRELAALADVKVGTFTTRLARALARTENSLRHYGGT